MTILQRTALGLLAVGLIATCSLAGPNAGGVLVVHATSVAYTTEITDYTHQSGVWCGNDGPAPPNQQDCPPYDPYEGTIPCNTAAAVPTMAGAADTPRIWYVMAAFADDCPRIKALSFGIDYDEEKVVIVNPGGFGPCDPANVFAIDVPSIEDSEPWPASKAAIGLSFSIPLTSKLAELYWFAAYSYDGSPSTITVYDATQVNEHGLFQDDSVPPVADPIAGYGVLGIAGGVGTNPVPIPSPVEETTWGQIKSTYSAN